MKLTVEMILRSLNQIRRVYVDRLQERMPEENLSPNEISILILLSNNPHITTAAQLCVLLGVSKSLISRSVERLTRRGILCAKGPSAHPPDAQRAIKAADRSSAGGDCRHQSQRPR